MQFNYSLCVREFRITCKSDNHYAKEKMPSGFKRGSFLIVIFNNTERLLVGSKIEIIT